MKTSLASAAFAVTTAITALMGTPAAADPGANIYSPYFSFANATNYAANPGFELLGAGSPVMWQGGMPSPALSAAASWYMHSNNANVAIWTELVATQVPQNGGARMLHVVARGIESGVFQNLPVSAVKQMFSVWIKVLRGQVCIQEQAGNTGPVSCSSKIGEWEQLRVSSDGTVPTSVLVIYNQDPNGGEFYADRVEARAMP